MINEKKLSSQLKEKYKIENNALKTVPKDDWKDRIEVEIGDTKQPDAFYPQVKVKRWDNEVNVSLRLLDEEPKTFAAEREKIKLIGAKKEIHFYDIAPCEELPEGGYEFEVILKEKPSSNVIRFSLVDKDVEYFYQPPLNQEPLPPEGARATETDVYNKDGGVICHRPENVVGSYAVYAKTPRTNWENGKIYRLGKVGHIYRPRIVDAEGKYIWGDLCIENGMLSVTIPQEFLDSAVYPVKHATGLTFGYTTAGASEQIYSGNVFGCKYTGAAGTGVSMSAYLKKSQSGTVNYKLALYDASDNLIANGTTNAGTVPSTSPSWGTLSFSASPTTTATTMRLAGLSDGGSPPFGNYVSWYYDSGDTAQSHYGSATYPTFPNPFPANTPQNHRYSIYCTYNPSATSSSDTRSARTKGKATSSANRNARTKGRATTSEARSARTKGQQTASETRNARTKGYATASETRAARIRGLTTTTDTRGLRIKGSAATSDTRDARTIGTVGIASDSRNARTKAYAVSSETRAARTKGLATATSERLARTEGYDTGSDVRSARTKGVATSFDNRSARMVGVAMAISDNRDARVKGREITDSHLSSRIIGKTTSGDGRQARTKGAEIASAQRGARTKGLSITSDERSAQAKGQSLASEMKGARTKGEAVGSDSRGARLKGCDLATSAREARAKGQEVTNDVRGACAKGLETGAEARGARIEGEAHTSDSRQSHSKGQEASADTRSAHMVGAGATVSDTRSARSKGSAVATDARGAKAIGQTISQDTRNAKARGIGRASDGREARTKGLDVASIFRSAHTVGGITIGECRNAFIKGTMMRTDERPRIRVRAGKPYLFIPRPTSIDADG